MTDPYPILLSRTITAYHEVSDASLRQVQERCTVRTFQRGDELARAGAADPHEYFLLSGILHAWSVPEDGEPVTTRIFLPLQVVTPHIVRTSDGRSLQALTCLQDAIAAVVPVRTFASLMRERPDLNAFGHKVVEHELARRNERELSLLTMKAKDRVLRFREQHPNLENLVPHTVISSFLGITPVSFSRLRNELARSKD